MKHEFKVKQYKDATVYTLESATSGGTSAGADASVSSPIGGVRKRGDNLIAQEEKKEAPKPRNFVAKNAKMGGAGQHKDKKKDQKQGKEKHRKPYMESLKDRIAELKNKLDEVSLGDYRKKAGMQKAQAGMGAMFGSDPEKRAQDLATYKKRERGLDRVKARDEKARKAQQEKQIADLVARLPELKAKYDEMKARYKSLGGSDWQYADREQNLTSAEREARSMEGEMSNLWRQIQAAEKAQAQTNQETDEAAPALVRGAAGLALGGLAAAGTPGLIAILGPILGTGVGAVGAWNAAKYGMASADAVWDWAAKKLGGEDNAEDFALAHINASLKGQPSFEYNGKTFKVKASPEQAKDASAEVRKLSENNKKRDDYMEQLASKVAEKLDPNAPTDVWVKDFQKANPNKYHQFKNKTPAKKAQMAVAAHYAANEPSKKK